MANINIQMKQRNGAEWDSIYPATKATNVEESAEKRFVSDTEKATWNNKQSALGFTPENIANKGVANGYASLGADGKILSAQIPLIAITDTFTASTEVAMFALTVQKGDVCVRTDLSKSYINSTGNNAEMSDWTELRSPTAAVSSVNSKTGAVTLNASDVGAEPLITKKTGFNLDKSDSVSSASSTTLATSAAVKAVNDVAASKAKITVAVTAPTSPSTGDFWYEITA